MSADWTLPVEAFDFLGHHLDEDTANVIVELGSGDGTPRLRHFADDVCAIEHDAAWVGRHADRGVRYIHAPIVDGWYDPEAIRGRLPEKYHCIIVDGPPAAIGRIGMLKHLDLFQPVPLLVDDVHRPAERDLAIGLANIRREAMSVHMLPNGRAFATIGWGFL